MVITSIKNKIYIVSALVVALLLLAPLSTSLAQEEPIGGDRGVDVIAGPHAVRVVMINSNLAAGFMQIALFITDANTGETVSDAQVKLIAKNEDDDYEGSGSAHNSPGNPKRYDGRMNLASTGEWVIDIEVTSPLGHGGTQALVLEVPALNRYTNGSLVFFAIFGAMMLGVAYLFWSVKRQNRRRQEAQLVEAPVETNGESQA